MWNNATRYYSTTGKIYDICGTGMHCGKFEVPGQQDTNPVQARKATQAKSGQIHRARA
jgi:hypothetical protein